MATEGQIVAQAPLIRQGPFIGGSSLHYIKSIFGLAAAIALGVGVLFWAMRPGYTPVFSHQSDIDALQMTEVLKSENIAFQIDPGSGLVLVPEADLQKARMALTGSGIASGGTAGFEALRQEQPIGTSQFMEAARYHHVLETELGRTISSMRNIESARIHLAMPKQSVFVRQRARTSASVMIKLMPGRSLDSGQVSAIVHLISSSVPYLDSSSVAVVDQWGRMLSSQDDNPEVAATKQHLEYTRKLENDYVNRIETLLTPIVGYGKVKAQINAELDFTVNESFEESYNPNSAIVRSEQIEESQSRDKLSSGVPGALANQPPAAGVLQESDATAEQASSEPLQSSKSTTRNFEVDKTIRRTRQGNGEITRLTVAVVIDDKTIPGKKDDKGTSKPFTEEEMSRFTELVKQAIGFKESRGDSVQVLNSAFQQPEMIEAIPDDPIWKQPWIWSLLKQLAGAGLVLFMVFGIVRPALRSIGKFAGGESGSNSSLSSSENRGSYALGNQSLGEALPPPPQVYGDILNMARAMAADDPKRVAKVIKDWVSEDGR